MKIAAVAQLKASLSAYLKRVKAGEAVVVTERGKPVAKLVPLLASERLPHHLREMEKQGLITIGTGKLPKGFWDLPRFKDPEGLVIKAIIEEREEGR